MPLWLSTGTIADYGRRRTFQVGTLIVAIASVFCALSPDIASSLGIIAHTFPVGSARAAANGVWGASVGAGVAIGPLLSAGMDQAASWRGVYWLICASAVVLGIADHFLVGESRTQTLRRLDIPGVLLLGSGISALLAALVEARQSWMSPDTLTLAVAAVALLVAFAIAESRSSSAMLDLKLSREPDFVAATVGAFATGLGIIALMSYMSGFLGVALHISSLGAALLLFVWSGISVVSALLARRILQTISGRAQMATGLIGVGIGQLALWNRRRIDMENVYSRPGNCWYRKWCSQCRAWKRGGCKRPTWPGRNGKRRKQHRALCWIGNRRDRCRDDGRKTRVRQQGHCTSSTAGTMPLWPQPHCRCWGRSLSWFPRSAGEPQCDPSDPSDSAQRRATAQTTDLPAESGGTSRRSPV